MRHCLPRPLVAYSRGKVGRRCQLFVQGVQCGFQQKWLLLLLIVVLGRKPLNKTYAIFFHSFRYLLISCETLKAVWGLRDGVACPEGLQLGRRACELTPAGWAEKF